MTEPEWIILGTCGGFLLAWLVLILAARYLLGPFLLLRACTRWRRRRYGAGAVSGSATVVGRSVSSSKPHA